MCLALTIFGEFRTASPLGGLYFPQFFPGIKFNAHVHICVYIHEIHYNRVGLIQLKQVFIITGVELYVKSYLGLPRAIIEHYIRAFLLFVYNILFNRVNH